MQNLSSAIEKTRSFTTEKFVATAGFIEFESTD